MTQQITIPVGDTEWLSANDRHHWAAKAKRTKALRSKTALLARRLTPITGVVHACAFVAYPRAGRVDVANSYPTIKACIDGLVDAGILEDDSHKYLLGPDMRVDTPTRTKGLHQVRIVLTPQHTDF